MNGGWEYPEKKKKNIRTMIEEFYKTLYSEDVTKRPRLVGVAFSQIPLEKAIWLGIPFEEKEIM